jgi:uncharacterized protein involved in exopolysaccharide biosynthesis
VIRFLETFFRHRMLVVVPVLLGLMVSVGYALAQPPKYEALASLWVDNSVPGNQTSTSPADQYIQPSDQQVAAIHELLATRAFDVAIAHRGPLAQYLAAHPNEQKGLAAIPVVGKLFRSTSGSVDDRAATELPAEVSVTAAGPQVISLAVQESNGDVAAGTAKALVDQFLAQILASKTANDQAAVDYASGQVSGAQTTLLKAQAALTAYLQAHPGVPASGSGDAAASQLAQSVDLASRRHTALLDQYEQAQLDLANVSTQAGVRVIDEPSTAGTAVGAKKAVLMAGIAGILIGLVIGVVVLLVLTAVDRTARRASDIEGHLGLEVAAAIPGFGLGRALRRMQR